MEHELLQLLHLPAQDHLLVSSGYLDVVDGVHFAVGPATVPVAGVGDASRWVEDLVQLSDELFGAGGDVSGVTDGHQPCSPDGPPPSLSMDGDGSPPSGDQGDEGDDASAATRKRRDRSETIVSERKRRVRMKEKLYELRNLQSHTRKLKEEVTTLEARPRSPGRQQQKHQAAAGRRQDRGMPPADADDDTGSTGSAGARVMHLGATQVGEGRFFVTVECKRRDGVAVPLCAAVESLPCFRVESSSLGRSAQDRIVSTLTIKASDQVGDATVGEGTVKLWVIAALLEEGFRPEATVQIS